MRTDLSVRAVNRGDMRVDVQVREHVLPMDFPAEAGRNPTPLEVLMASLAACAANTLHLVLSKKMGVKVESLEVEALAQRRSEHPTILTDIELIYHVRAEAIDPHLIEQAGRIAEDHLCPVLGMLRPGTNITSTWVVQRASVHG
jgi:uncharacterized OsmC-like protein